MKKKITIIGILLLFIFVIFSQQSFAKYIITKSCNLDVYIDKTPPTINIKSKNIDETFSKTDLDNIVKESSDITISTTDNIKISYNECYFNANNKDFSNIEAIKFDSGKEFVDEGYYKIVAVDTSGNTTEKIFLLDKSAPTVKVEYFKKGEVASASNVKTVAVAGIKKTLLSSNIVENIAESENIVEKSNTVTESQNVINNENTIENAIIGEKTENTIKNENVAKNNNTLSNEVINTTVSEPKAMLKAAARASSITVYNESDLRNAINNKYTNIVIATSINCTSSLYINYAVTIRPGSNENAIRYNGYGSFIYVQSGGSLTLASIVVDTRGMSNGRGINSINVQSGGTLVFDESSIVDGGTSNTGILINGGGKAVMYSCHIANCTKGIVVKGTGNLTFGNYNNGRNSEFWSNTTSISFESFTGTCNFNQANIVLRDSTNGIVVESSSGKINISAGKYYNNSSNGIASKAGTMNITGGNIYSNGYGVNFGAGDLNISGGSIYSNSTGVLLNSSYSGKMTMSGGSIYSNSSYAINHSQNADGACTITGGSVSGNIYLGQSDNYVNTNSSYPTFTVKPSSYYFKRKLVKTTSNAHANNEISKVTMSPSGSWYKYVEDEYIKVWQGCNVKIKYTDYYGNILSEETITGNVGETYTTNEKELEDYDLITKPTNATGTYTTNDITVEYKYDLKNVAKITFEDLLSGIENAKYWYNATSEDFSGDGTDFENNEIFEDYGFYKVIVKNNVGLEKELIFSLNKDSLIR